jgi:hypothetical protein
VAALAAETPWDLIGSGGAAADDASHGARAGSAPRLAWFGDCGDYEGVPLALVLVLVVAGAVVWWRVGYARWGLVRRVVFWLVVVAVLWVLVNFYSVPHPEI